MEVPLIYYIKMHNFSLTGKRKKEGGDSFSLAVSPDFGE